jgi:solute carrier family 24 (sodium/potassium/calcium exchanger), member 6
VLFFVVLSFYFLGTTADKFLTPVLTKISTSLKLSEAIAGVTLLAFANGAPDIISSFSAAGDDDGVFLSIGGLYGASLFAGTMVVGNCILKSQTEV